LSLLLLLLPRGGERADLINTIRGEARTSKRTFPSPTAEREEAKSIMMTIKKKSRGDLFFLLLYLLYLLLL
jgi:hypothetical protein